MAALLQRLHGGNTLLTFHKTSGGRCQRSSKSGLLFRHHGLVVSSAYREWKDLKIGRWFWRKEVW